MLGGFGSINHMIVTLRNNKKLMPNKRSYFKPNSYQVIKTEYNKAADASFNFKKATPAQLKKIRAGIIQKRKREARNFVIIICVAIPLIGFGIFKTFQSFSFSTQKTDKQSIKAKNEKQYMFYIKDGDSWLLKRHYFNAVFQYKKALQLFPSDFEANYRLAMAYSYRCQYDFEDCGIGMKLTHKLEDQFPSNQNIKKIKSVFVHWGE